MGAGIKAVTAGTKAATKLKSTDLKRLFAELTDRVEQMSEALQDVLREQRDRLPEVREKAETVAEAAREKAGAAAEAVREKTDPLREAVREKTEPLREAVRERAETVTEKVRESAEQIPEAVKEQREELPKRLRKAKEKAPSLERKGKGRKKRRRIMGLIFNRFTVGFGTGYVLGARAGRERYEQIVQLWNRAAGNPTARQAAERGKALVGEAGSKVASRIQERRGPQKVREVMTPMPSTIQASEPAAEASRRMRELDVGSLVVVDEGGSVVGVLTDRDIVVRALAEGRDPNTTTVRDISSQELATLSPDDSVDQAVQLMRDKAVRRLPVLEGGRPVGIVSIGDLALERDRRSVLADISEEPPNQ